MAKDNSKNPTHKRGIDGVRLGTLGGVIVLLVISILNWQSIDRTETRLDMRIAQIENRLAQVSSKVDTAMARNQPQQRGPDPNRVYTINTAGAPVKGPAVAPVTIAEFSDFQ